MKINDCFDTFLSYVKSYCAADTVLYYQNCLHVFDKFLFDNLLIDSTAMDVSVINHSDIVDYVAYLRISGVSSTSVRSYVRGVKVFFKYLLHEKIIQNDICADLKLPKPDDRLKQPLSQLDAALIIQHFDDNNMFREKCVFYLMLDCGLRLQEVVNLNVDDVNSRHVIIRNSKNNKSRVVPLPIRVYSCIQQYVDNHQTLSGEKLHPLFVYPDGTRITKGSVKSMFSRLKMIVPDIHAHLLRHTFATSFIMGGGNIENLRVLLGHGSYSVTQNYIYMASQLSLSNYDIYRIDDIFFESFNYHQK